MRAVVIGAVVMIAAGPSMVAQSGRQASAQEQAKARSNMSIMEGILERAVQGGAQSLNQRVRAVSPMDPPLLLAGNAEVRGFRLQGYGIFFDVQVPVLRQSVAWSLRALMDQNGVPLTAALQQLQTLVRSVQDPRSRQAFESALRRVELQVGIPPVPAGGGAVANSGTISAASALPVPAIPAPSAAALAWLSDPNGAYTTEVKNAIVDAMLEHSGALGVASDEWLTVAARDNEPPDRMNPADDTSTILLRIKGSDLAALRAGRLTADEARKKVEIREY